MKREDVYAGLFALLAPITGDGFALETASRRLEFAEDVDPSRLPGVWQLQVSEQKAFDVMGGFAGWFLLVDWYIYVAQGDESEPSSPVFNPVIDAVTAVLPFDESSNRLIVAGEALSIILREPIKSYEGILNNKAVVVIPLRILVPDSLTGD